MSLKLGRKGKEAFIEPHPPTPNYFFKEQFLEAFGLWSVSLFAYSQESEETGLQDWTCLTSVADSTVCSITHQPNEMLVMSLHLDTIKLGEGERKINRLISKYKDRPLSVPQINYCFNAGPKRNKACLYFD